MLRSYPTIHNWVPRPFVALRFPDLLQAENFLKGQKHRILTSGGCIQVAYNLQKVPYKTSGSFLHNNLRNCCAGIRLVGKC